MLIQIILQWLLVWLMSAMFFLATVVPETDNSSSSAQCAVEEGYRYRPGEVDERRLQCALDNRDFSKPCPAHRPGYPDGHLFDYAEILRFVNGCLFIEYELLDGRTLEEVQNSYVGDATVMAVRDVWEITIEPCAGCSW